MRSDTKGMTPDWLLSTYIENTERPVVKCLDNTQLLDSYPPKQNSQEWTIELFSVQMGKLKGKNAKQLWYIKGGLGDYYQFSFDFAWSPDSKKIALQ